LLFACSLAVSWVSACQVPVFRYALERWLADRYEVVVLHDGQIDEAFKANYKRLETSVSEATNAIVRVIDMRQSKDPMHAHLWARKPESHPSLLAILYPQSAREIPERLMAAMPFTDDANEHLFSSPVRETIAQRLSKGQSAVWVFVPSGQLEKDEAARQILEQEIVRCQQLLVLPTLEELELKDDEAREQAGRLRIEFTTVTLNRDDSREHYLMKMLLGSESDLATINEPLAFPVFGRGRVLYALVGKGINREMIHSACQFMVGPCSCQVKAQNPGFDLLMNWDWETSIGGVKISDPLPDAPEEPVLLKIPPGRKPK
jgi:hypothetical protein